MRIKSNVVIEDTCVDVMQGRAQLLLHWVGWSILTGINPSETKPHPGQSHVLHTHGMSCQCVLDAGDQRERGHQTRNAVVCSSEGSMKCILFFPNSIFMDSILVI